MTQQARRAIAMAAATGMRAELLAPPPTPPMQGKGKRRRRRRGTQRLRLNLARK
jgi:hypothetical protein